MHTIRAFLQNKNMINAIYFSIQLPLIQCFLQRNSRMMAMQISITPMAGERTAANREKTTQTAKEKNVETLIRLHSFLIMTASKHPISYRTNCFGRCRAWWWAFCSLVEPCL